MPRTGAQSRSDGPAPCLTSQSRKSSSSRCRDTRESKSPGPKQDVRHEALQEHRSEAGHDGEAGEAAKRMKAGAPATARRPAAAQIPLLEEALDPLREKRQERAPVPYLGTHRRRACAIARAAARRSVVPRVHTLPDRSPAAGGRRRPVLKTTSGSPARRSKDASAGKHGDSSRARGEAHAPRSDGRAPGSGRWRPCRPVATPVSRASPHRGLAAARRSARTPPRRHRTRPRQWRSSVGATARACAVPEGNPGLDTIGSASTPTTRETSRSSASRSGNSRVRRSWRIRPRPARA